MTDIKAELMVEEQGSLIACSARASQSRLHNFSFSTLSWGSHRVLRCINLPARSDGSNPVRTPPRSPEPNKGHDEDERESPSEQAQAAAAVAAGVRPWNLRTRRAACTAPYSPSASPTRVERRSEGRNGGERREFSVTLLKEEIEEDFLLLKRTKPPRRPKKRPRAVQKQLDALFPGLWLSEVTLDLY